MLIKTNRLHRYIFPEWAAENKKVILGCALISFFSGAGSAALMHLKMTLMGMVVWYVGLSAVLLYGYYYLRATYQRYVDCAWDVYY